MNTLIVVEINILTYEEAILIVSLQLHPIYTLSFKNRKEIFSYQTYLLYLWRFLCLPWIQWIWWWACYRYNRWDFWKDNEIDKSGIVYQMIPLCHILLFGLNNFFAVSSPWEVVFLVHGYTSRQACLQLFWSISVWQKQKYRSWLYQLRYQYWSEWQDLNLRHRSSRLSTTGLISLIILTNSSHVCTILQIPAFKDVIHGETIRFTKLYFT